MIQNILNHELFEKHPPVLVDIGASGEIHPVWKKIAPFSYCVAFDPDSRDFQIEEKSSPFKKLFCINKILSDSIGEKPFYLTKSPYCSSTLPPNEKELKYWMFSDLFEVESQTTFQCTTLPKVMSELDLPKIDWIKTDTQGTDLKVIQSLSENQVNSFLVAEFEPGINSAYQGEDKMHQIMSFMERHHFWIENLKVKGTARTLHSPKLFDSPVLNKKALRLSLPESAFWGEMRYINNFSSSERTLRDYLLGSTFSLLIGQFGFAHDLAMEGQEQYNEPIFSQIIDHCVSSLRKRFYKQVPQWVTKKIFPSGLL